MSETLKFIHASDFSLGTPISAVPQREGCAEMTSVFLTGNLFTRIPAGIFEHFLSATREAMIRVFDAAMKHEVDFVLLTGRIFSWESAGPAGAVFLAEQFGRLEKEGIFVFWAASGKDFPAEQGGWDDAIPLPENVYVFPPREITWKQFFPKRRDIFGQKIGGVTQDGVTILHVPPEFMEDTGKKWPRPAFSRTKRMIAVGEGSVPPTVIQKVPADYWGFGGRETRLTRHLAEAAQNGAVLHYPGSPQGRSPAVFAEVREDVEPRFGCSLVEMSLRTAEPAAIHFLPTEEVAWKLFSLTIPDACRTEEAILAWMREELSAWRETGGIGPAGTVAFWYLKSKNPVHQEFLRKIHRENLFPLQEFSPTEDAQRLIPRFLAELQKSVSEKTPFLWNASLEADARHRMPPEWKQNASAVGDFLRLTEFHREELLSADFSAEKEYASAGFSQHTLDLMPALEEKQREDELRILADVSSAEGMSEVLGEAEIFGAEILLKKSENS